MATSIQVFLSYAHQDSKFAETLEEKLEASSILVWRDRTSLPDRGPTFRDEINRAIDTSRRLLLLLTADSAKSEHVRAEWQYAKQSCKKVTVLLPTGKDFDVPSGLELDLDNYVDWQTLGHKTAMETLIRILKEPTMELGRLSGVPKLPIHWVPREPEIKSLVSLIFPDSLGPTVITGATTTALQGMGGIGKTMVAAAFAAECRTRWQFSDGVFWLSFGLNPDLIELVTGVLETGRQLAAPPVVSNESIVRALSAFLEGRRCLLILDDVWRQEHAQVFLEGLSVQSRILITTRDGEIVTNLGAKEHRLGVLSDDEAMRLLADWSGQDVFTLSRDAWSVARECENLPFALSICGAMALDGIAWADINTKLVKADIGFLTRQGNLRNYPYPSVLRCLQVSTDVLEQQDPVALRRYLELAAFSRAQVIPEEAIVTLWTFDSDMDATEARALIVRLDRKALLRLEKRGAIRVVSFHDLQRDFLDATTSNAVLVHSRVVEAYHNACRGIWTNGADDGYFFQNFPSHLSRADRHEELLALLSTFRWLLRKLKICGWSALIKDYELVPNSQECETIAAAIRLSAHAIAARPDELAPQLIGRLSPHGHPLIKKLLEEGRREQPAQFLCPVSASLIPPGGSLIQSVAAHRGVVKLLAASADGTRLVSAAEAEIKIWNVGDFSTCFELPLTAGALALSSGGDRVAVSTDLHQVVVYDVNTKQVANAFQLGGQVKPASSHGNKALPAYCLGLALAACAYFDLPAWSIGAIAVALGLAIRFLPSRLFFAMLVFQFVEWFRHRDWGFEFFIYSFMYIVGIAAAILVGKLIRSLKFEVRPPEPAIDDLGVTCLALSADESTIVVGSKNSVRIWDVGLQAFSTFSSVSSPVTALARSNDLSFLVVGTEEGTLLVWDGDTLVRRINAHPSPVTSIAITDDRKRILSLSQDHEVKIWNLNTGTESAHSEEDPAISSLSYIPKHSLAVYGTERGELRVFDPSQTNPRSVTFHSGEVLAIASQDSRVLTASADRSIRSWDCSTGKLEGTLRGHDREVCCVTILSDRSRAVSGSYDGTVKIWDLLANVELESWSKHPGRILGIVQWPNPEWFVSADESGLIRIWSSREQEVQDRLIADIPGLTSFLLCESSAALFYGDPFGIVKVDLSSMLDSKKLTNSPLTSERVLAVDPTSTRPGMGAFPILADRNGQLLVAAYTEVIWVVSVLPGLGRTMLGPVSSPISAIALLGSSKRIVSGHQDGTVIVWDPLFNCEVIRLRGHTEAVIDIACLPGDRLISASSDGKLNVWELTTSGGSLVAGFTADSAITGCHVAEGGRIIAAAEESGRVHFLRISEPANGTASRLPNRPGDRL